MKTKESIAKYNKEYCARPEVIARAKAKNVLYREQRRLYKKTLAGKLANRKHRIKPTTVMRNEWLRIKKRYGIDQKEYEDMLAKQDNRCAICFRNDRGKLHVDHCHKTNKVRGFLCGGCNRGIGLFQDDVILLNNASKYLLK